MDKYQVEITQNAQNNFEEILTFLIKENSEIAHLYYRKLIEVIDSLKTFPERGRRVPEYKGNEEIREVFVHKHRIIYKINKNKVYVLYIWHGMRILKLETKT